VKTVKYCTSSVELQISSFVFTL